MFYNGNYNNHHRISDHQIQWEGRGLACLPQEAACSHFHWAKAKLRKLAAGISTRPPDSLGDATARAEVSEEQEGWDDANDQLHTLISCIR